jgi:putative oxidoreductase
MSTRLLPMANSKSLTIARISLGFLLFVRGAQGLLGWFGGPGIHGVSSLFRFVSLPGPLVLLAVFIDFFGGIGLIVGLFTRIAAFCVAAEAAFTLALWFADPRLFVDWSITQGGAGIEYYVLVLALASLLAVEGAGAFSLDHLLVSWMGRRNTPAATRPGSRGSQRGSRQEPLARDWSVHSSAGL